MSENRRRALDRLRHLVQAADRILEYVARGRAAFDRDEALRDAIVYQVIVLGEAAKAVLTADPGIQNDLSEIEWGPIVWMRDRLTHHYWTTDRETVWSTATIAVAELRTNLASALQRLE